MNHTKIPRLTWRHWRRGRQIVQIIFFILYIYLLFAALQRRAALPMADLFFRLDPLAALAAMLASRAWIPRLALALLTIGLTILVGRVWCGWICPLGTLLEWISFRDAHRRAVHFSARWRIVNNFLLFVIVTAALFGNLTLLILDPITLFTRTMTAAFIPALNHAVTSTERALYPVPLLRPAIDWLESVVRGVVLPVEQPVFTGNLLIAALFCGIIALNLFAAQFWCRYLCPLGALLGLLSKISLLRPVIGAACNRCGHCGTSCSVDAIDTAQGYEIIPSECIVCLDCLAVCPTEGIGFEWQIKPAPRREYDPTRRQMLAAVATGAASVVVLQTGTQAQQSHPYLLRPPGVTDEDEFLSRCIRCSQCMKVCPTAVLQPTIFEAGLEGVWTPRLATRLGYCAYDCNACGQICPSDAIPTLDLETKRRQIIGLAFVDRDRCLPWAYDTPCIVCEEMCPVPDKAIKLEEVTVTDANGTEIILQRPYVIGDLCIGCGICEYQCPMGGAAAIRVMQDL